MNPLDTDLSACRARQERLLHYMHLMQLDMVVVTQIEHVQYLAGPRFGWVFSPAAVLHADGKLTLVAPAKPTVEAAADEILTYDAQLHSTLRNDQRKASSEVLMKAMQSRPLAARVGVEFSSFGVHMSCIGKELVDIEPTLYRLRRKKDDDELARICHAIDGTKAMYKLAREIIRPGISEIEVFNRLQGAAVEYYGEMLTGTGNDYQCGSRGGPPRNNRLAEAGELYILDLGPAFRGYFADNSRAIAVDGQPSELQLAAWSQIMQVFKHLEATVKPGKSCRELFDEAQAILDQSPIGVFNHHLGHGIGLFPHEAPHLNPNWDDVFQVGDVFTAEPGLYAPELRAGMRIENDYLVTEDGVKLLSDIPLEL
ncbi:peptidase M24 [Pirellula staleyi DSM 6068]|uniref:Peptidase M24 n=1 Tax=Pirellula staleyi (strain ATCC 27377 / DSM 6068 / ICPB 4128) TaxID=530564 RepID=D2R6Z3_PIRSD|nr:Xaa-Pro peptidase family protein [Pirellula staleyi]ADB19196.1 peptidase M24 [Pirellula staleyi DSM 6068]